MKSLLPTAVIATSLLLTACAGTGSQQPAENVHKVITGLEGEWVKAIIDKDTATLDRIIANDFTGTSGDVHYLKADAIEDVKKGSPPEALSVKDLVVHVYGDTAVATMTQTEKTPGTDETAYYFYSNVWVKRNGQWQAVASHGARVK